MVGKMKPRTKPYQVNSTTLTLMFSPWHLGPHSGTGLLEKQRTSLPCLMSSCSMWRCLMQSSEPVIAENVFSQGHFPRQATAFNEKNE